MDQMDDGSVLIWSTHSKSFGIHSILDQRNAVAEGLAVEIGVLLRDVVNRR